MKIAYLMNTYPMTSTTFVRREIQALEKHTPKIVRYAIRRWSEKLVDPEDIKEQNKTKYIFSGNLLGISLAFIKEIITNPIGFAKAIILLTSLIRNAKGALIHHAAYLFQATYLRQECVKDGIKHVHVHFSTNSTTVAMISHKLGGPNFSFTVHGPDEFDSPIHASLNLKISEAVFVVAITSFCKSQLIRYSSFDYWDKIKVFNCGIDIDEYDKQHKLIENNYQLVCVGRLCTLKGQLLLPDIISKLAVEFPKVKLIIIGDGDSRKEIENKINKLNVGNLIELLGWQSSESVRDYINESRALILPSFAEGLPIVFMESFALRRPVLATYIAGIPEMIDNSCGWVIPAGDQECLLDSVRSILNSSTSDLDAKGLEGYRRIRKNHSIDLLAESLNSTIKKYNEIQKN